MFSPVVCRAKVNLFTFFSQEINEQTTWGNSEINTSTRLLEIFENNLPPSIMKANYYVLSQQNKQLKIEAHFRNNKPTILKSDNKFFFWKCSAPDLYPAQQCDLNYKNKSGDSLEMNIINLSAFCCISENF